MEEEKEQKYKIRIMPLNIFFIRCEDDKGNKWFDISLNGCGYPSIKETEKALNTLSLFLEDIKKKGQKELNKINKEIREDWEREMTEYNTKSSKKHIKEKGYIYLLKSKNLYKIGRAKYPKERIKTYKTENPFGIKVILQKKVDDYVGIEAKLLKKFEEKKVRGEWFKLNKEDLKTIKTYLNGKKTNS